MKNWQETEAIVDRLRACGAEGKAAAVATVVGIEGSTYRRPGAKLLVHADGSAFGNVSGGCLEGDLAEQGKLAMEDGRFRELFYDTRGGEDVPWGFGLGCDGTVTLWVEPWRAGENTELLEAWGGLLRGEEAFCMATRPVEEDHVEHYLVTRSGELAFASGEERSPARELAREAIRQGASLWKGEASGGRWFVDYVEPPPWLVICGAGDDAQPLASGAAHLGFRVCVADHRAAYAAPGRFASANRLVGGAAAPESPEVPWGRGAYVVIMTHSLEKDGAWLRRALREEVRYIGLLGPRARREKLCEGLDPDQRRCIFGPCGLDLGGEGPEQVAHSLLSEILAVHHGRPAGHLRDRAGAIHERSHL